MESFKITTILFALSYHLLVAAASPIAEENQTVKQPLVEPTEATSVAPPAEHGNATVAAAGSASENVPVIVVANITKSELNSTNSTDQPIEMVAKVTAGKPEEMKTPAVALVPPPSADKPFELHAKVPPNKPVEIHADVPEDKAVNVRTEVSPDVPLVALVVGHGTARYYSPWKKASSTTRNMFNVNLKK